MTTELLSMLGGGLAGFIFRFMAMSVENQQKTTEMLLKKQAMADDSADRAASAWYSHWPQGARLHGPLDSCSRPFHRGPHRNQHLG